MTEPISTLLFPRDMLNPKLVDEHFRGEATAARKAGLQVALVDHDAVVAGDTADGIRGIEAQEADLVYRGWMIRPHRYAEMYDTLHQRGVSLRTQPAAFQAAHHLPNWYPTLSSVTPESVWTTSADLDEFETALGQLGRGAAVLKDYSKSEKHYWDEAMFIPDVADATRARPIAERFLELRDTAFDTGFVVRRYEELANPEARTWWRDGTCIAATAHPDTPDDPPPDFDLAGVEPLVRELELGFITVDIALSATTGEPRVVEVGDGQVSDRPSSCPADDFIAALTGS